MGVAAFSRGGGGGIKGTALLCAKPDQFRRCRFGSLDAPGGPRGSSLVERARVGKGRWFAVRNRPPGHRPPGNPDMRAHACSSRHPQPQPPSRPAALPFPSGNSSVRFLRYERNPPSERKTRATNVCPRCLSGDSPPPSTELCLANSLKLCPSKAPASCEPASSSRCRDLSRLPRRMHPYPCAQP